MSAYQPFWRCRYRLADYESGTPATACSGLTCVNAEPAGATAYLPWPSREDSPATTEAAGDSDSDNDRGLSWSGWGRVRGRCSGVPVYRGGGVPGDLGGDDLGDLLGACGQPPVPSAVAKTRPRRRPRRRHPPPGKPPGGARHARSRGTGHPADGPDRRAQPPINGQPIAAVWPSLIAAARQGTATGNAVRRHLPPAHAAASR